MNLLTSPLFCLSRLKYHRAVSPVVSSVIILAITVTLGLALWSNVNSNVSTSTESFTNEVTDYVNYINDRYVIVNLAFGYDAPTSNICKAGVPDTKCVTVWVYNYAERPLNITNIVFGKTNGSVSSFSPTNNIIASNSLGNMTIQYGNSVAFLHNGTSYDITLTSSNGVSQSFFQKDG